MFPRFFSACLALGLVTLAYAAAKDEPVNALWNDHDGFGIWIYPSPGACPEIRSRVKSFVVIGPERKLKDGESKEIPVSQLKLCSQWGADGPTSLCDAGTLKLKYNAGTREYLGVYEFDMEDGSRKRGSFRAQYCKYGL